MGYENVRFPENSLFLITGGAGFIGSNLCESVLDAGCRVRCLDNLSTGRMENMDLFIRNSRFEFIEGDIRNFQDCMSACRNADFVLHQAAWGSVPKSIKMPLLYCVNNITGTVNMLEAARQNHVKKFVYASSSSVYGDEPKIPKQEGREGNLLSPYAASKRADEEWARQYTLHYGLDTYGLRYFNVFGRRQNPDGDYAAVIPRFIRQLLHGEQPVIYGDGMQSRDFTYIENVMEANLKACCADSEKAGQVFNIASGGRERLIDVYWSIVEQLGLGRTGDQAFFPQFGPVRSGDIAHSSADIENAVSGIGYSPDWSFERGLKAAIQWYKENL